MKKLTIGLIISFVALQITFLCLILWGPGDCINIFEFLSIVCAFVFSMFFICKSKGVVLTETALFFTVMADLFLEIVSPMQQTVAMIFFSIVQTTYFVRLFLELKTKTWKIVNIVARIVVIVVAEFVAYIVLKDKLDLLSIIAMFYISNLLLNIILSFVEFKKSPLLAIGLLLFLGCDIFVGLQQAIGTYITVPPDSILYKLAYPPINATWLCYLPSQTLLCLSVLSYNKNVFAWKNFGKNEKLN